jgi:membrane-associated phospholipid phosphatase
MKKKQFVIIWIILALGMVLGSFIDLPLSLKLYDESNRIGIFMNFMAMVPSFILLEICCCVSSWYHRDDRQLFFLTALSCPISGILCADELYRRFHNDTVAVLIVGTVAGLMFLLVCAVVNPKISRRQAVIAESVMIAAAGIFLITATRKFIWGRQRFYSMEDPISQFTHWLKLSPIGFHDSYRSFPSGHTSFASLLLCAAAMPGIGDIRKRRILFLIIALGWLVMVMYGRIVYGAHFMTDTCAGALIGTFCVYLGTERIERRI